MSDYKKQLKNLTFDCTDPSKIYASTNKYYFIVEKQCENSPEGEYKVEASLPAISVSGISNDSAPLNIPYQGTFIFAAGSATQHTPITVTMMDRDDFLFRKYLLQWQYDIHSAANVQNNLRRLILAVYNHDNSFQKSYVYHYAFPELVDAVGLSWQAPNTLATYGVTFRFAYNQEVLVENELPTLKNIAQYSDPGIISVIPPRE